MADSQGEPRPSAAEDPFRDIRGEGSEGDLMGAASLTLLCAFCCVCTLVSLLIAYLVWALATIVTSVPSTTSECGEQYKIWVFCLMVVIVMPIVACVASFISIAMKSNGLQTIPGIINLALSVWGMILWATMGPTCTSFYDVAFPDLFLLFKINVVLLSISFFIFICVVCAGVAFLGNLLVSDGIRGKDAYQKVPGSEEDARNENLRTSARYGRLDEVDKLLREGANVNSKDPYDNMTALHYAALGGHQEVAQRLVNAGANIDAETSAGDTPLRLAQGKHAWQNSVETFLRSCGARDSMASPSAEAATQEYV